MNSASVFGRSARSARSSSGWAPGFSTDSPSRGLAMTYHIFVGALGGKNKPFRSGAGRRGLRIEPQQEVRLAEAQFEAPVAQLAQEVFAVRRGGLHPVRRHQHIIRKEEVGLERAI